MYWSILQFAIDECISNNVFKDFLKNTYNSILQNTRSARDRELVESLWVEIEKPFKERLLINVRYCSSKHL